MDIFSCQIQNTVEPHLSYAAATQERESNSPQDKSIPQTRSVGSHTRYWATGRTLKIAIMRLDDALFDTVKNAINQWAPYVNLTFEFIDLNEDDELYEGDIRIEISPLYNTVARSLIGTDALAAPSYSATMWLGTNSTEATYEAVAIHEFGHALGRLHEHQHPDANIPWDREKVYKALEKNHGMSRATVDATLFPLPRDNNATYAPYDRHSVMHYQVTNDATLGDWEQLTNLQLSEGDIAFARQMYP
ncbi:M12 family metallopeptidase [Pseudomonas sp.]|uniref:M12 family metallopeptidase n=1 Tax=Pseudomonas sp. TaxID=306 RepID=UPI003F2C361E